MNGLWDSIYLGNTQSTHLLLGKLVADRNDSIVFEEYWSFIEKTKWWDLAANLD